MTYSAFSHPFSEPQNSHILLKTTLFVESPQIVFSSKPGVLNSVAYRCQAYNTNGGKQRGRGRDGWWGEGAPPSPR